MRTPPLTLMRVVSAASLIATAWLGVRLAHARTELRETRARAESLTSQLSEINSLAPRQQTAIAQAPPEGAVTTDILAALGRCGLPAESILQQSTGSEEPVTIEGQPGGTYARRSVAITLAPLTLTQLGSFISDWKKSQPAWIISKIDLSHVGDDNAATYSASLRLTATYLTGRPDASTSPRRPTSPGASS